MEKVINKLIKKYKSVDPFFLAKELGICVLYEELGTIKGYYNKQKRQKFIHINNCLDEVQARFTAAHELGHALLHSGENTPFLRENTFFSTSRLEVEANTFALRLLYRGLEEDLFPCSLSSLAATLGVQEQMLIKYYHLLFS